MQVEADRGCGVVLASAGKGISVYFYFWQLTIYFRKSESREKKEKRKMLSLRREIVADSFSYNFMTKEICKIMK